MERDGEFVTWKWICQNVVFNKELCDSNKRNLQRSDPNRWAGSSVGIVTEHGLGGPGIESRWGRNFPSVQTGPGTHQASCTMGTGPFKGVEADGAWG